MGKYQKVLGYAEIIINLGAFGEVNKTLWNIPGVLALFVEISVFLFEIYYTIYQANKLDKSLFLA